MDLIEKYKEEQTARDARLQKVLEEITHISYEAQEAKESSEKKINGLACKALSLLLEGKA